MGIFDEFKTAKKHIPKYMCFYHAKCWDGSAAAWVFSEFFGFDDVEYIPCTHGKIPPQVEEANGRIVFVVDFAFDEETTLMLRHDAQEFILLDHHITAQQKIGHLSKCYFDMNHSGSMLMFNHLNETKCGGQATAPLALKYFEALDLYRNDTYNIGAFGSYLRQFDEPSIGNVHDIVAEMSSVNGASRIIAIGTQNAIVLGSIVDNISEEAFYLKINSNYVRCAFSPKKLMHEVAMENSRRNEHGVVGAALSLFDDHVGISLRVDNNQWKDSGDTLEVSAYFGGGGHKFASGARMTFVQFVELYKERNTFEGVANG